MGKLPYIQFFTGDWIKDPKLTMCSASTRGIWIDAICAMHESEQRGIIEGSPEQLARIFRASLSEVQSAVDELQVTGTANVIIRNGSITLINRRMKAAYDRARSGAERQRRMREKGGGDPERWTAIRVGILQRDNYQCRYCGKKAVTVDHVIPKSKGGTENSDNLVACCKSCNSIKGTKSLDECGFTVKHLRDTSITPYIHISSSKDPPTPLENNPENGGGSWKIFFDSYPAHRRAKRDEAAEEFRAINPDTKLLAKMLSTLETMKVSEEWQREEGRCVPGIQNWLKSRCWEAAEAEAELPPDAPGSDPRPPKGCDWERDEAGEIIHPMRARKKG